MKLNISNPIIFFDLEMTGIDVVKDRIVELCYIKVFPNGNEESKVMRLNPCMHISEASTAVHGIKDEDVADCPTFKDVAHELKEAFNGCDLAGFNSNKVDVPMLFEEFVRAGICDIDFSRVKLIDIQNIYHKLERRTLGAAYKFYCGKDLENAHSALADTRATLEVLEAQLDTYPDVLKNDIEFLSDFSKMNKDIDFAGRFVYDDKGEPIVNFGKHKGRSVYEVFRTEPSYYAWVMQNSFSQNTKQVLQKLYLNYKHKQSK